MLRAGMKVTPYVRRGDRERRLRRLRAGMLLMGGIAALALVVWEPASETAQAEERRSILPWVEAGRLRTELENAKGDLALARNDLARYEKMFRLAARYDVPARLSQAIYEAAVREKIDPELAFRLVKIESDFKEGAQSPVGAVGLTQLMLPTARHYEPNITREQLFERDRNLRIGFRYLRGLISEYRDVGLALLVYNRGPAAVDLARANGLSPSNGYDQVVMRGYKGRGITD
jgi:soluble lytic murein transglycosylase-like protein